MGCGTSRKEDAYLKASLCSHIEERIVRKWVYYSYISLEGTQRKVKYLVSHTNTNFHRSHSELILQLQLTCRMNAKGRECWNFWKQNYHPTATKQQQKDRDNQDKVKNTSWVISPYIQVSQRCRAPQQQPRKNRHCILLSQALISEKQSLSLASYELFHSLNLVEERNAPHLRRQFDNNLPFSSVHIIFPAVISTQNVSSRPFNLRLRASLRLQSIIIWSLYIRQQPILPLTTPALFHLTMNNQKYFFDFNPWSQSLCKFMISTTITHDPQVQVYQNLKTLWPAYQTHHCPLLHCHFMYVNAKA